MADDLRAQTVSRVLSLPLAERIALALSLGDDDLDLYARVSGIQRAEALQRLRARRCDGRQASVASLALSPRR